MERIIKENDWVLEILSEEECKSLDYLEISSNLNSSGTQIIWEKIERYDEGDDHFDLEKERVKKLLKEVYLEACEAE